jgi:4a-hydroxytetrahydrobiopterin dehydratase
MDMKQKACKPCQGSMAPLTLEQAKTMLVDAPGWELNKDGTRLSRHFSFTDFVTAQAFALRVGELAEREGHHPVLSYSWGYCDVVFFTHEIGGLHENDFIMAAKLNALG